jgi:hypothetical protein
MKATDIIINKLDCDDAGIKAHQIPTDLMPATGDIIVLDGVPFKCTQRLIEIQNGMVLADLTLRTTEWPSAN